MNTERLIQPVQAAVRRSGGGFVVGSVLCALTSVGGGALSVLADARWLRLATATVAMLAAAGWALTWWNVGRPTGPVQQRALWLLGVVALSLCASVGALFGSATWLGRMLANRPGPLDVGQVEVRGLTLTWYDAGVLGLALLAVALLTWWSGSLTRAFAGFAFLARRSRRVGIAGVAVGVALTALSGRGVPNEELSPDESRRVRELGAGRYDRMLVIDPADQASRMLIRLARELVQTGDQRVLLRPTFRTAEYNLAYGLAVAQPPRGERPLWRLVEPPTEDPFELAASLARIKPRDGPPATGSYGRLLVDTLVPERVRWRTGAQRGVAFVLDELPSLGELDRGMRGAGAIGRWADPSDACEKFVRDREIRAERVSEAQSVAVAWGDALAAQCRVGPTSRVALDVLTGEKRLERVASWRSWSRALGGRFDSWGDITPPGRLLISAARALHTGQPVGQLGPIVDLFRPHLAFDKQEEFFPVDIDWLLTPEVRQPRTPPTCTVQVQIEYGQEQCTPRVPDAEINRVCDREAGKDNCEDIANAASLVGQLDEFLDFAGGGRLGRDRVGKNRGPSRMYVHVLEHAGHLYLGYWWFLPFNASPWRPEVNCLPGLAIKDATCFDHEGDWEGVTVVLELIDERALPDAYVLSNLKPDSVLYEAHGTPIRWPWELVELAADRGSGLYATHPVVYVAKGSHASYPAPCDDEECDQRLARLGSRGEGGFDGAQRWTYNHRCADYQLGRTGEDQGPCLAPLPATGDGLRGVLWNAFPGRWGKATCSVIAKFCSAVDGPRSPSHQPRFKTPSSAGDDGLPPTLRRQRQRYGGTAGSKDPPAWPPPGRRIPDTPVLPSGR